MVGRGAAVVGRNFLDKFHLQKFGEGGGGEAGVFGGNLPPADRTLQSTYSLKASPSILIYNSYTCMHTSVRISSESCFVDKIKYLYI